MADEIVVPELGEIGMELVFVRWLRAEGDVVQPGDALFEVDTDKSTVEVEAYASGTVSDLRVGPGDTVAPRQVIGLLLNEREAAPERSAADGEARGHRGRASEPDRSGRRTARVRATPRARRLAEEHGISVAAVAATGAGGIVTAQDVTSLLDGRSVAPAPASSSRARRAVAERTVRSWQRIPHFHLRLAADVTDALERMRPTTMVCAAAVRALVAHPECNVAWVDDEARPREGINLGVLVDSTAGLQLGTLRDADRLEMAELDQALRELVARAQTGHLTPDDLASRSLTVSNLGMYPVDGFDAVISAPDTLVLSVGRAVTRPRWFGDGFRARRVIELTLAVDHRALDGAAAARLLGSIEGVLSELGSLDGPFLERS